MKNAIEAVNLVVNGVNVAFQRGAYNMKEVHDLHEAIEYIKQAVNQSANVAPAAVEPNREVLDSKTTNTNQPDKEDYYK
jgi:hypothetical protein